MATDNTEDQKTEKTEKTELRTYVKPETVDAVRALAESRSMTLSSAVDHLVQVGTSRIRALKNHNKVLKTRSKKAKPKKVAKKAKRAKKVKEAAAPEATAAE